VTVAPDGRTANARGIDFALIGWSEDGGYRAEWREAVFENTFVKQDGAWKIAVMHLYPRFATDYALGWAKDAQPAPAASREFPPDAPPSVMHGVYPNFYIPPFHFRNPVTDASPQYPDGTVVSELPANSPAQERLALVEQDDVSAETLSRALASAERRLERAIAFDAVENLANAYNFYLDEFDSAAAGELFGGPIAADVIGIGVAGGRESIIEAIAAPRREGSIRRPSGFMMIHQTGQAVIDVAEDGASAGFRLRLFGSSGELGEEGAWIAGIYDGQASAQNGNWQLDRMDLNLAWAADYTAGWASAAPTARITNLPRWRLQ